MTSEDFAFVCRFVRARSAIVLEPGKEYLVEARLAPVARELRLDSVGALIGRLKAAPDSAVQTRAIEALVTTETSFFRDGHPFDALREVVLPKLIRRKAAERRLSVWCAACATGQEPYSVALLLREHFPALADGSVHILATDLSGEALGRARDGCYTPHEVFRGLPAGLLAKDVRPAGPNWRVCDEVRATVTFRELNLIRPWPVLPPTDLIFLRNVMIDFDVETKREILAGAARQLEPRGYLLLGTAETPINLDRSFRRTEGLRGGFYRLG
jgi:chemotaxis protein methyltransferase CheR